MRFQVVASGRVSQRGVVEVRTAQEVVQVGFAAEFLAEYAQLLFFGEFLWRVPRCFQTLDFAFDGSRFSLNMRHCASPTKPIL